MDRADRQGLGVALAGHIALVLALLLGLTTKPVPMRQADTMTVQLVPDVTMRSAAPKASREAPAPPKAEQAGKPADAAPPSPSSKPAPPAPAKPSPPKPAPPKPVPPKPTPPKPKPEPAPEPKPAPKPAPKPKRAPPKPAPPKPAPPKPAPKAAPEKPAPSKPEKAAPAKPAAETGTKATKAAKTGQPAKAAKSDDRDFTLPSDLRGRRRPDEDERATGTGTSGKAARRTGSLLGSDFSKDIAAAKEAKGSAPQASQVGARAMSGLVGIIAAQVKPCYNPPAGGSGAGQIVTVLSIRMNRDGSVASVTAGAQTGVNDANVAYAKQMADAARRAVLRCSPLKLPADLYAGGWDDFDFRFRPEQMQ